MKFIKTSDGYINSYFKSPPKYIPTAEETFIDARLVERFDICKLYDGVYEVYAITLDDGYNGNFHLLKTFDRNPFLSDSVADPKAVAQDWLNKLVATINVAELNKEELK